MQKYENWKNKNSGSAILEALNRGPGNNVSTFGSVDSFISGLLGSAFNKNIPPQNHQQNTEPTGQNNLNTEEYTPPKFDSNSNYSGNEIDHLNSHNDEIEDSEVAEDEIEQESNSSLYKIYRDKEEIFECNISVQGAKLSSSQVRLIFDHELCNLVFYGKIAKDGKCAVPLKKMNFYPENSTGRVRLEVIVDDTIFIPWEETFIVEGAKKVTVQVKSQKKIDFRF